MHPYDTPAEENCPCFYGGTCAWDGPVKCKCGVTLDTDMERIAHDCDYYPQNILEHNEFWTKKEKE